MIYAHILQSSPPFAPQDYGSVAGTFSPTTTSEPVATRGLEWLGRHPGGLFVCPSIHYSLALVPSAASVELFITNQRSPGELRSANSHPQKALRPQGLYTWYPHRKPSPGRVSQGETPGFPGKWQLLHPSAWLIKPLHLDAQCWPTEPAVELAHRGHDS